jgi:hypothetical protein
VEDMGRSRKAYKLVQELVRVQKEQVPRPWLLIVVVLEAECRHSLPLLYMGAFRFFFDEAVCPLYHWLSASYFEKKIP